MADKVLDALYLKALKAVAKERRGTYTEKRIPEPMRQLVKQRAAWQAGVKIPGKKLYLALPPERYGHPAYIIQVSPADVRQWGKKFEYDYSALGKHIGKIVFSTFHEAWHHHPPNWRSESTSIKMDSPEGQIIRYKTIDLKKFSKYSIGKELEKAFGPQKKNDMRHYKAMLAESKKVGMPKHYNTDLTKHDQIDLSHRDPDLPVGWILRESGTQLIFPEQTVNAFSREDNDPSIWEKIISEKDYPEALFYSWDGVGLHKNSREAWASWMKKQHRKLTNGED